MSVVVSAARVAGVTVATASLLVTSVAGPVVAPASAKLPNYPQVARQWDGSTVLEGGWVVKDEPLYDDIRDPTNGRRQADYNPPLGKNVEVVDLGNGNQAIRITTRRHCTKTWTDPLVAGYDRSAGENEYTTKCPAGLKTRYSTGRIESSDDNWIGVGSLTVARVKLPRNAVAGTRFAVWMFNAFDIPGQPEDSAYCTPTDRKTNLAELDLFEWYGKAGHKNRPHIGSHVGCTYTTRQNRYSSKVIPKKGKTWYKGWHQYAVEMTTNLNRYYLDSKLVRSLSYKKNPFGISTKVWRNHKVPPKSVWQPAFSPDMKFRLVVQGEVFDKHNGKKGSIYYAPSDKKPFPAQSMLLDYVTSYQKS